MHEEKTYLNQLAIYFTLKNQQRHLRHNFPTWPPSRVGKDYNTGNDEFDDINSIFSAHHNTPFLKEQYCHPNFETDSIGHLDNSICYRTIAPLKAYFLDELPKFNIHNLVEVSLINVFHSEIVLETPDIFAYMEGESVYTIPDDSFEIGFSHITSEGYIQRNATISRKELHHKVTNKFVTYPGGHLEYYVQNFMVYPYFMNQNLTIDLEHLLT